MTLSRRRFLSITAASAIATPALAATPHQWQGRALGADVEVILFAGRNTAETVLQAVEKTLRQIEAQFNLFDPESALSRLNNQGHLKKPDSMFIEVMQAADTIHGATNGLFDPTVQPLWRALAEGRDTKAARRLIGWSKLRSNPESIQLAAGQALTFNGIAQGYAADRITTLLSEAGLDRMLVNIGEFRGTGGPWTLGLSDPQIGLFGTRTFSNSAMATSSPQAVPLMGHGHILHTEAAPQWSTVSVEAEHAIIADGFSTALTLAPLNTIKSLKGQYGIRRVTLVDFAGDVTTV